MPSTAFNPEVHGFRFQNTFRTSANRIGPLPDIHFGGLCGGMSYAALDYFFASKPTPDVEFRPLVGDTLEQFIFARQNQSTLGSPTNLVKWGELVVNPFGARNAEFYGWGIADRLPELRAALDSGRPVPLGLKGADGHGDHQVIAVGYELGRYRGDKGAHVEDFSIQLCDPNYPRKRVSLRPDPRAQNFFIALDTAPDQVLGRFQSYFIDGAYRPQNPPTIAPPTQYLNDGLVHEVHLEIATGGDDLRGGNDNVTVTLHFADRSTQVVGNANRGQRWIDSDAQRLPIVLQHPVQREQLVGVELTTSFGGGIGGDNWNVDELRAFLLVNNDFGAPVYQGVGAPLVRFTGENIPFYAPFEGSSKAVRDLLVQLGTGGDDLRGGSDNVHATVTYRTPGRTPQVFQNVNKLKRWADNSSVTVRLPLERAVDVEELEALTLQTTFGGGIGGDNWNLDLLRVRAPTQLLYEGQGSPLVRFDGNNRPLRVELRSALHRGSWRARPGVVRHLAIGPSGAYAIGNDRKAGGYGIHRFDGNTWQELGGAAVRVAVDRSGSPWVVNDAGTVFKRVGAQWQTVESAARDIACGADGSIWVIGRTAVPGGFDILRYTGRGWSAIDGGAVSIAVAPDGAPWVLNDRNEIFRRVGNRWELLDGRATDIAIGADGSVWVIGVDRTPGGYGILRRSGPIWARIDGGATSIAVDPQGSPWVVNDAGTVFSRSSSA
ncbi:MAG: hypothetical protein RLZZ450_1196 [Pseudomonadota bacterium]|jgi:hypothetical protein